MTRKRQMIISILALLSLVLVTTGVSYSLLDYDENSALNRSQLTYNYSNIQEKPGLSITSYVPLMDEDGKKISTDGEFFHFSLDGTVPKGSEVPYEITVARDPSSTLSGDLVKVYLTEVVHDKEYPIESTVSQDGVVKRYTELGKSDLSDTWENRTLYQGVLDYGRDGNFHKEYNLRIWIDGTTGLQPTVLEDGTIAYPYQGKTFILKVGVSQKDS